MRKSFELGSTIVVLLCAPCVLHDARAETDAAPQPPPRVHLLATGGTIAAIDDPGGGYTAGKLSVEALLAAVPELAAVAEVTGEQVVNIASQDANDQVWLRLLARVQAALVDVANSGVVITHGTDTLAETALFIDRAVAFERPVVLTGSMRTPTAPGADGPANLLSAVRVAADPAARGRGCLVVLNDTIFAATGVAKRHTTAVQTFGDRNRGPIGRLVEGRPVFFAPPAPRPEPIGEIAEDRDSLPHVPIIYAHANLDGALIDAAVAQGARGIVLAGVGNGNASTAALAALDRARKKGVVVVRSSRVGSGHVSRNVEIDDDGRGFVAAGFYNPQQARVLLVLALTVTTKVEVIQPFYLR